MSFSIARRSAAQTFVPWSSSRRSAVVAATSVALLSLSLTACTTPPKPAPIAPVAAAPAPPPPPPPQPSVMPVEAEPMAPATQAGFPLSQFMQGPVGAMLAYADKVRPLGGQELTAELQRLGEPGDSPTNQMQVALVLAQTRNPADLARSLSLMQRVISNPSQEAQPLQPLARVLSARYVEQRRVEDDRDKQAQQVRDSQKRIDQLNDRLEALRAIERSFARPNNGGNAAPAAPAAPAATPARPAQ